MKWTLLFFFLTLFVCCHSAYNPIPIGSVIVSTTKRIFVMKPTEYNGTNGLEIIYSAHTNMTIINTVYDPSFRNLYILFTNSTNSTTVYACQLVSLEQLDSTIYQLPINFNVTNINQLFSFTSDVINRRVFLTDNLGIVSLFSMSGLMETIIQTPSNISETIRSATYVNTLNKLFIITDTKVYSCKNFETANFKCCEGVARGNQLRTIAVDTVLSDTYIYVLDERTGIYRVVFDTDECPTAFNPINVLGAYTNLHFVIDRGLYFASGSASNSYDNSLLIIANGTQAPRSIPIGFAIVSLHISNPNTKSVLPEEETCFHGITYTDYRVAVILAAIFGTIMGIFMCFNVLFCIDFFMTKRIIRNLKKQIPHNLLEDRWNKLVEEKYAKIALEKQRRKDDPPPPPPKRSMGAATRKYQPATTVEGDTSTPSFTDGLQVPNPIPKLSAYLRRKSESYLSRRRSDDYRHARTTVRDETSEIRPRPPRNPGIVPNIHIAPVQEENETQRGLRPTLSRKELLKDDDFL